MFLFHSPPYLVKHRGTFLATAGVAVHLMSPLAPKGSLELPGPSGRNTSDWSSVNVIDRRFLQSSSVTFRKGCLFPNVFYGPLPNGYAEKRNATDFLGEHFIWRVCLKDVSNAANLLFQMAHNSLISLFMSGQLTPSFKASI